MLPIPGEKDARKQGSRKLLLLIEPVAIRKLLAWIAYLIHLIGGRKA